MYTLLIGPLGQTLETTHTEKAVERPFDPRLALALRLIWKDIVSLAHGVCDEPNPDTY